MRAPKARAAGARKNESTQAPVTIKTQNACRVSGVVSLFKLKAINLNIGKLRALYWRQT